MKTLWKDTGFRFFVTVMLLISFLLIFALSDAVSATNYDQDDVCYEDVIITTDIIEKEVRGVITPGDAEFGWVDWPGAGPLIDDGRARSGGHNGVYKRETNNDGIRFVWRTTHYRYVVVGQEETIQRDEYPCPTTTTSTTTPSTTSTTVVPSTTVPETTTTVATTTTVPETTSTVATTVPPTTSPATTAVATTIPETTTVPPTSSTPTTVTPTTVIPTTEVEVPDTDPPCVGICGPATVATTIPVVTIDTPADTTPLEPAVRFPNTTQPPVDPLDVELPATGSTIDALMNFAIAALIIGGILLVTSRVRRAR